LVLKVAKLFESFYFQTIKIIESKTCEIYIKVMDG